MEFFSGAFGANYLVNPYIMAKIANFFCAFGANYLVIPYIMDKMFSVDNFLGIPL